MWQLLFYTVMGKKYFKKFLKSVSLEKKSLNPKHNSVSCKVLGTAVKDVEKFIQTVCYSGKKE